MRNRLKKGAAVLGLLAGESYLVHPSQLTQL